MPSCATHVATRTYGANGVLKAWARRSRRAKALCPEGVATSSVWDRSCLRSSWFAAVILPEMGDMLLRDVRRPQVLEWRARMEKKEKPGGGTNKGSTANGWLRVLKQMLSDAVVDFELPHDATRRSPLPHGAHDGAGPSTTRTKGGAEKSERPRLRTKKPRSDRGFSGAGDGI